MTIHDSTFMYHKPTDEQMAKMDRLRSASKGYAGVLEEVLPDGPDKTFIIRQLRTVAMWANVAITRLHDGTPRN